MQHDGPLCDALRQARRTLDYYPKVEVAVSSSISSPMALGILRPIIVFPADLVEKLRTDELTLILMHELAHVRRWDNLTLLLQRLVSAVLFFHPAVWLCGRMLRREAEQACDDLVVCVTGRSEAYARGLAHVAERAAHLNPLIRRIPTMNAFAAESDLALRIRRTLGGGARQMGMRTRVLVAVLLCPLAAVTLPSVSKISAESSHNEPESSQDERLFIVVDQDGNMKLKTDKSVTFATLKQELQAKRQLLDNNTMLIIQGDERSTHGQIAQIMDIARQVGLVDQVIATEPQPVKAKGAAKPSQDAGIWQEAKAMATDPDEWSDELKTQLLILKPGSTIEEIAAEVRKRRIWEKHVPMTMETNRFWRQAMETDPDEWSDKLKAQLVLESGSTIEEIAEKIRKRRIWREAEETYPDDWSDELKAQLLTLKTDSLSYEIIAAAESAELVVYSPMGEPVRTFVLGHQNSGKYHIVWDGRDDAGRELGSGVYFYRLKTNPEEASDWRIAGRTILVR